MYPYLTRSTLSSRMFFSVSSFFRSSSLNWTCKDSIIPARSLSLNEDLIYYSTSFSISFNCLYIYAKKSCIEVCIFYEINEGVRSSAKVMFFSISLYFSSYLRFMVLANVAIKRGLLIRFSKTHLLQANSFVSSSIAMCCSFGWSLHFSSGSN